MSIDASITVPELLLRELKGWILLSINTLALAGVLALVAVISRTPGMQAFLPWPWQDFFAKVLVTHVILSTLLWILSLLAALATVSTARITLAILDKKKPQLPIKSLYLVMIGTILVVIPTLFNWGSVSLNNYVPVLVHPLFYIGLGSVSIGVLGTIVRLPKYLLYCRERLAHHLFIVGSVFILALAYCLLDLTELPEVTDSSFINERLFWGGGHILQFVNTMLVVVMWWILVEQILAVVPAYLSTIVVWSLYGVALSSLLFYVAFDVSGWAHREAFTQLLKHGLAIPPLVMIMMITILLFKDRQKISWHDTSTITLIFSLALFVIGGSLGYFLGIADTRIPAHYHAAIGSVNLSAMGIIYTVFLPFFRKREPQMAKISLILYGSGQLIFSLGLFAAGMGGVPRKIAGMEQEVNTIVKILYMGVYGIGGIIAVSGGILFIWLTSYFFLSRKTGHELLS